MNKERYIFPVCIYRFVAVQQTSTLKLPANSSEFQTKEHFLSVNKSEITGENAFNGNDFGVEGNHRSGKEEKIAFSLFWQICDPCF